MRNRDIRVITALLLFVVFGGVEQVAAQEQYRYIFTESGTTEVESSDDEADKKSRDNEEKEEDEPTKMQQIMQQRRVDRQINRRKFIFKGEQMYGVTASYISLDSDNTQFYMLLDNIAGSLKIASVKPFGGYFYRDNRAVGGRFGYSVINGTLDAATIDLGEVNELSFDIPYVSYRSRAYSAAVFHRAYAALDPEGHFGLFADVELSTSFGESTFEYEVGGAVRTTNSYTTAVNISFNPGLAVFILHNVCASVSFEFGGVNYTRIDQFDADGVYQGYRESSGMRFMFNMLAINMGVNVHF
ncbi:MAG: hypothetical protein R3Y16_02765 [Rikenellaceae bacterium]